MLYLFIFLALFHPKPNGCLCLDLESAQIWLVLGQHQIAHACSTCVHFELAGHSSVCWHCCWWKQFEKEHVKRKLLMQSSKGRALSGCSFIEVDRSRQSERSSVERRESVVWPERRHRSRLEQVEWAVFSGARRKGNLGVSLQNIGTKDKVADGGKL